MLQVRDPLGPNLGFRGSLDPNSSLEIVGIHGTFRWGWNSILDRSAGDDSFYMLYRAHLKITGKADSRPAKSPVAGGYAFHKCSDGGGDAYFDTEKRLWRGKGCEQLNSNPH